MRKNTARKWVHLLLDLLPVLIIPIFAIYEINHDTNTPVEVEQSVNEVVNYNQYFIEDATYTDNYYFNLTTDNTANINYQIGYGAIDIVNTHKYYFRMTALEKQNASGYFLFSVNINGTFQYKQVYSSNIYSFDYSCSYNLTFVYSGTADTSLRYWRCYLGFYDLTQMFGLGNEPTISDFESYYPNLYYPYSTGKNIVLSVGTEVLNNTDIGSQLIYSLYKPVRDYFNFNNVFNFGDIYHWFELNMFGGNAPMPMFIIWNVIVYEFLVDLIFLIYSIFMFIIDFSSELLARCFSFSNKGGTR